MTPEQVDHVQTSFRLILPIRLQAAQIFYARLFEIDASTRPLFLNSDLEVQGDMLMAALGFVVGSLRKPESMLATVHALARRHVGYGVVESHYTSVGEALVWTVERGLGSAATPEILVAWVAAYTILSDAMLGSLESDPRLSAA